MATLLEFRESKWVSADGRFARIKDLEVGHLVNVLNWIKRYPQSYPSHVYKNMVREAHYRKLILFAEGNSYPTFNGTDWELVDAKTGENFYEPPPQEYIDAVDKLGIKRSLIKETT
jgi:hypothetical protein